MLRIMLAILFFLPLIVFGQAKVSTLSGTVQVADSAPKDELFIRAKKWFADTQSIAHKKIDSSNLKQGKIFGRAWFNCNVNLSSDCHYSKECKVKIHIENGMYKYVFSDWSGEVSCGHRLSKEKINPLPINGDSTIGSDKFDTSTLTSENGIGSTKKYAKGKNYSYHECADELINTLKKAMK